MSSSTSWDSRAGYGPPGLVGGGGTTTPSATPPLDPSLSRAPGTLPPTNTNTVPAAQSTTTVPSTPVPPGGHQQHYQATGNTSVPPETGGGTGYSHPPVTTTPGGGLGPGPGTVALGGILQSEPLIPPYHHPLGPPVPASHLQQHPPHPQQQQLHHPHHHGLPPPHGYHPQGSIQSPGPLHPSHHPPQPPYHQHPPHGGGPPPPLRLPGSGPTCGPGSGPGSGPIPIHSQHMSSPGGTSSYPHQIPMPQTPQGTPGVNPFGNGPGGHENDLPPQLLELGWKKFWSRRENRWYFWNCGTGESLWEIPPIPGVVGVPGHHHGPGHVHPGAPLYDPLTDPLGIVSGGNPGLKRRSSSGETLGSPNVKRFLLSGPWDLEVSSNVFSSSAPIPQAHLLPPHPEIEFMRAGQIAKLRQSYQQACVSREGIDAPKDSLNQWIMERKITELRGIDPIFPTCDNPEGVVSPAMLKEIMRDIPMKVEKPRFTGDARKQLSKFAEACKKTIETRSVSSDARKMVKWKAEETFTWLRNTATVGAPYESFQERINHLKEICLPHVHDAARPSVERICKKVSLLSKQYAQSTHEAHLKLFIDPQNIRPDYDQERGRFRCHPVLCGSFQFTEAGRLPVVEFLQQDRDHALLKFKTDSVRITTQYLCKLEQLYRYNCVDDRKFEFFLTRVYILLKRYNSYSEDFVAPHRSQGALPVPVFEAIQRNFGVTFECFSSPFNCYFRQYCSAFPDIDGYFGSRGSFLDYHPLCGSFEMNPPLSDDLIDAAITHVEELLAGTREPMSFIIFVPDNNEDKDEGPGSTSSTSPLEYLWLKRLEGSRWKRKQVTIPAFEHEFRHGAQHVMPKSEVSIRSGHPTIIFWLQNDAGWEEWKPTDSKVDALVDSYRPGRERERDRQELLAPERQNPHQADKAVAAAAAAAAASMSVSVTGQ